MIKDYEHARPWQLWQKLLFRFFFIYFILYIFSWPVFGNKVPVRALVQIKDYFINTAVNYFNTNLLHYRENLVNLNNSDDTSFRFVQILLYILIAVIGTVIWSVIDRNKKSYNTANYILKNSLRYFISLVSFFYGSVKVFGLQMAYPTITEMATPLGDLTSAQLAWLYVGYSPVYQIFLGLAEVTVGILLLYRRTVTLGLITAFGVYINVMMINLNYDIVVKMFSVNLVVMAGYLLITDAGRLANFFMFNKPGTVCVSYDTVFPVKKSHKVLRILIKAVFILYAVSLFTGYNTIRNNEKARTENFIRPIAYGKYAVTALIKNGDTVPVLANDSLVWKDFIFEKDRTFVSVNTTDTIFARAFNRGLFYYKADTIKQTLACYRRIKGRKVNLYTFKYTIPDTNHVELRTTLRSDTIYLRLTKSDKKFKLAENSFNWLVD